MRTWSALFPFLCGREALCELFWICRAPGGGRRIVRGGHEGDELILHNNSTVATAAVMRQSALILLVCARALWPFRTSSISSSALPPSDVSAASTSSVSSETYTTSTCSPSTGICMAASSSSSWATDAPRTRSQNTSTCTVVDDGRGDACRRCASHRTQPLHELLLGESTALRTGAIELHHAPEELAEPLLGPGLPPPRHHVPRILDLPRQRHHRRRGKKREKDKNP